MANGDDERARRLAAQLRANLRRRKARERTVAQEDARRDDSAGLPET